MSEAEPECLKCSVQYADLLAKYRRAKKKIRKMRKSFAAIECALTHRCEHYSEFIIGECEAYRGKYEVEPLSVPCNVFAETE